MGGYVVVMFDAGGWHALGVYIRWSDAIIAHGAAINALRVVDHPHSEEVKIIPNGAGYAEPGLPGPLCAVCFACVTMDDHTPHCADCAAKIEAVNE